MAMIVPPFQFLRAGRLMREMNLLSAIDGDERVSQRRLAALSRLSTTMVNTYVGELADRGLIRVCGATNRDTRYVLTEAGGRRLSELIHLCSKEVIQFYGIVKREFQERLRALAERGVRRVVLFGAAETCEVTVAASLDTPVDVVGIVDNDPAKRGKRVGACAVGSPRDIAALAPDAVVITSHGHSDEIERELRPLREREILIHRIWADLPRAEALAAFVEQARGA